MIDYKFRILGRHWAALLAVLLCAAPVLYARDGAPKRVRFEHGHYSAVLKNSVVRGERDTYVLGARAGQMLTVNIVALEHNAVFSIRKPGGGFLAGATDESDATKWRGKAPATGDYLIEVGGTRGNATYTLTLRCR